MEHPDRIWKFDETKLDYIFGKKERLLTSASSNHGGFKTCSTTYSTQKHITALVAVSSSGQVSSVFHCGRNAN